MNDDGPKVTISLHYDPTRPGAAGVIADVLGAISIALSQRGVTPIVLSPDIDDDPDDEDPPVPVPTPKPPAATAPAPGQPAKRVRDRTAERRAAREKAAAQAAAEADPDPLLGGNGKAGAGDPFDDDDEDDAPVSVAPAPQPEEQVRTPKQCMEGSLAILRQVYGNGGEADVKALQKTYKLIKFTELELDRAPALWKDAVVLAKKYQVDIPLVAN